MSMWAHIYRWPKGTRSMGRPIARHFGPVQTRQGTTAFVPVPARLVLCVVCGMQVKHAMVTQPGTTGPIRRGTVGQHEAHWPASPILPHISPKTLISPFPFSSHSPSLVHGVTDPSPIPHKAPPPPLLPRSFLFLHCARPFSPVAARHLLSCRPPLPTSFHGQATGPAQEAQARRGGTTCPRRYRAVPGRRLRHGTKSMSCLLCRVTSCSCRVTQGGTNGHLYSHAFFSHSLFLLLPSSSSRHPAQPRSVAEGGAARLRWPRSAAVRLLLDLAT